jgi:hypothetical protein
MGSLSGLQVQSLGFERLKGVYSLAECGEFVDELLSGFFLVGNRSCGPFPHNLA